MPNSKLKKIFYVWNYKEWGGAQIYFFGLIREIKDKAAIKIILPANSDEQLLEFIEQLDVEYEFLENRSDISSADNLKRKIERHWKKFRSEFEVVLNLTKNDLQGSVIHIEFAPWQSLFALSYLCLKANVFITMHNSLPPVSKWRYLLWKLKFSLLTKFDNFYIFPSNEDAKKSLKPLVSPEFYEKTKVTYTNVNPDEVEEALSAEIVSEQLKSKYNIPKNKFLIFCVGQFIDRKGRWTFLDAAQKVFENDKETAFVWISNSKPDVEDLRKAESYGLGENFIFITSDQVGKEHIDLFKLLRLADVFALVSFQEGLPISLLEAMALGIPSISTNVNAIPEAVKHLETGWLIEAGDDKHLAEAIDTLKTDENLREKLSKNGREFVLANFNEKVVAQIALNGYKESFDK
jgi:glycosyltransferase involved in cell wall biosynthesis